jgi:hypothetical protein
MNNFINTFFTTLPYDLYETATNTGNLAYTGIALGLIKAQKSFWVSIGFGITAVVLRSVYPLPYIMVVSSAGLMVYSLSLYREYSRYLVKLSEYEEKC